LLLAVGFLGAMTGFVIERHRAERIQRDASRFSSVISDAMRTLLADPSTPSVECISYGDGQEIRCRLERSPEPIDAYRGTPAPGPKSPATKP
jgi:hypothetical protein